MARVQVKRTDDESIEIFVDGECICYANHDEDGWSGMEKVESLAEDMAKKLKISFESIEEFEDGDDI